MGRQKLAFLTSSLVKLMPLVWGSHIKYHCQPWDFGESYAILCVWSFSHQAVSLWFVLFSICTLYIQKINNNNLKSQYDLLVSSPLSIAHGCSLSPWHDCHSWGATPLAPFCLCQDHCSVMCECPGEQCLYLLLPSIFFPLVIQVIWKMQTEPFLCGERNICVFVVDPAL